MSSLLVIIRKFRNNSLYRRSALLLVLMYLSPVIGLILEVVMIRVFSAGAVLDSFRTLMTFMLMGQGVVSAQLLKYAVIPRLSEFHAQNRDREGLLFTCYFTGTVLLLLSPILFIGLVMPEMLLMQLAPGFDQQLIVNSAGLVRVTSIGFILTTVVGSMAAVLNFYNNFWGQPCSQILLNLTILLAVLIFGEAIINPRDQLFLLQYSVAVGLALMLLLMIWQCVGVWNNTSDIVEEIRFIQSLSLAGITLLPQLFIIGSEVVKPLAVNRTLSEVGMGSIVLYLLAFKLLMIGNLPIRAIITVLFPDLSRLNTNATSEQLKKKILNGTIKIFLLSSIASILLWVIAPLIVSILSVVAQLTEENNAELINVYRILLFFAPFAALGLFYMESAFAFNEKKLMIVYSLVNTGLIVVLLPEFTHLGTEGVARVYAMVQGSCMLALGMALYVQIYKRSSSSAREI